LVVGRALYANYTLLVKNNDEGASCKPAHFSIAGSFENVCCGVCHIDFIFDQYMRMHDNCRFLKQIIITIQSHHTMHNGISMI
jgi:hypothetical protein